MIYVDRFCSIWLIKKIVPNKDHSRTVTHLWVTHSDASLQNDSAFFEWTASMIQIPFIKTGATSKIAHSLFYTIQKNSM